VYRIVEELALHCMVISLVMHVWWIYTAWIVEGVGKATICTGLADKIPPHKTHESIDGRGAGGQPSCL
jgi:hypothetical protein